MAKRIMLPFDVAICPLAVLAEDAVILGAASDHSTSDTLHSVSSPSSGSSYSLFHSLDFSILERTVSFNWLGSHYCISGVLCVLYSVWKYILVSNLHL